MGLSARFTRRALAQAGATLAGVAALPARLLAAEPQPRALRWAVDYGAATDPALARTYDLLVLEPDHERAIAPLRGPGAKLLGYLIVGEIARSRPEFAAVEAAGALFGANPDWPDARMADLRHPAWRRCVVEQMAPRIIAAGFDGLFLDTLDNAEALERRGGDRAGMVAAGAALVRDLRRALPGRYIMMNRGYALLDAVAPVIDGVLGEAMATRWNFATKSYERLSPADWQWQADRLRDAARINPALDLMTLDYWNPADGATVAALYAKERAAGFAPYVATLALDRLLAEPGR